MLYPPAKTVGPRIAVVWVAVVCVDAFEFTKGATGMPPKEFLHSLEVVAPVIEAISWVEAVSQAFLKLE